MRTSSHRSFESVACRAQRAFMNIFISLLTFSRVKCTLYTFHRRTLGVDHGNTENSIADFSSMLMHRVALNDARKFVIKIEMDFSRI